MQLWAHGGTLYEVNSYYSLPDDAWQYELVGQAGAPTTRPYLIVLIPDATPEDGPFTAEPSEHARVTVHDGQTPWPILRRFVDLIEQSGDITHEHQAGSAIGALTLSNNAWQLAGQRFEVNSFHFSDRDSWSYELYEADRETTENNYVEVLIPDTQPAGGPFTPATANQVTFTAYGTWTVPWPVFRHFLDAIEATGDIVGGTTDAGHPEPPPGP
jgi:hypothetical protein